MEIRSGNIICSENISFNYLEYEGKSYRIEPLSKTFDVNGGKGGNSNVFKLFDPELDVPEMANEEFFILKFCKYSIDTEDPDLLVRINRFRDEIKALKKAKLKGVSHIVSIEFNDALNIDGHEYLYYVMERGSGDLLDYMKQEDIPPQQQYVLCKEVVQGIKELHDISIYHRDIKPDNVFFVGDLWKIGDLGLIKDTDEPRNLDGVNEKIGPSGWLSPEAVNKMLCEGTKFENAHCCEIKSYSDVFQLGKLIWFIFEGTAPIGLVDKSNFRLKNMNIYELLIKMLQHSPDKRPTIEETLTVLENEARYFVA